MLHLANLLMSMFSAGQFEITSKYRPNPCSFYLLNLGIDTTLGIPILIFILHILNRLAAYTPLANPPESIESGNYGAPPRAAWWFKQAMIYFFGLLGMKICVFFLIQLLPFIVKIGDWALRWTEGNTALQIIFVMLLFPVIMNAIQYYIIDTFIKRPLSRTHELLQEDDEVEDALLDDGRTPHNALLSSAEDADTFGPKLLFLSILHTGLLKLSRHNSIAQKISWRTASPSGFYQPSTPLRGTPSSLPARESTNLKMYQSSSSPKPTSIS